MSFCADRKIEAVELLQRELGIEGPFKVERLVGGFTGSEVIKVDVLDQSYVVRFWNMQWADYFPQDLACQLIASEAGYGPKVYFSDAVKGITIMKYHFPEPLPSTKIKLQALVDLLKKIHAGPAVPKGMDRSEYLNLLLEDAKETRLFDLEALKTIKDTVFAVTRPYAHCVTCHRDLHHGNLIYTEGRFYAIDYNWGAMDDPYSDLANIAIFNCESLEEDELLLKLYLRHDPSPEERARLALMKLPIKIFYGLEFLEKAFANTKEHGPPTSFKSYRDFEHSSLSSLSPADLLHHATSFLSEVIDYAHTEQYAKDLSLLQRNTIKIQEIDPSDTEKIEQARSIFISYFAELYKDMSPETLGISNVPTYLKDIFNKTELALKERVIRGFLAYIGNKPAGFSACGLLEDSTLLLIRTIPIHLDYKNRELEIRHAFLSYFHQHFPTAQNVVMMVRKANTAHASLCRQAGFKKDSDLLQRSSYLKATYNPDWYECFVYRY
jgi:hypothetical protein